MSTVDEQRWLDQLERRTRQRGYATAEAEIRKPCPSPGCPHTLYVDCETRVLRCGMCGPMECIEPSSAAAAATE